jgi:hypothetical protein
VKVERELQDRLHAAVVAGDPTASAQVFKVMLEPLVDWLGFRWRNPRDAERVRDFAVDSIISYLECPSRYDPEKASLLTYLRMDAHGDLINDHEKLAALRVASRPRPVTSRTSTPCLSNAATSCAADGSISGLLSTVRVPSISTATSR